MIINTIGRRKTAVARLYLKEDSKHTFQINNRKATDYFAHNTLQRNLYRPFEILDQKPSYEIDVRVRGGGLNAQSEAVRMALSKALVVLDEEQRAPLRAIGFLTRDPRMVERKKYGRKKARKRFQFSKR